ncbi:MAG: hypothetical protein LBI01_05865 [Elusimicrobium sp.]|jgi:hypothetical protein|nr:hypothetical protein [Elusimicrobium sp.]
MIVFWRLLFALMLTDLVFQPKKFYDWEMRSAAAKFIHLAIFFILAYAFNFKYLDVTWFQIGPLALNGIASLVLFSVLHYALDLIFERPDDYQNGMPRTVKIIWHKIMMVWAVFIISPDIGLAEGRNLFPEPWLIAACGLILVTGHAKNIICSYEFDFYNIKQASPDEVYFTALQRAVMYGFCLMPGYSWLLWCAAWFGLSWYAVSRRFFDVSKFSLYYGAVFALITGVLVRIIIYIL